MIKHFLGLIFISLIFNSLAQPLKNKIFDDSIKTAYIHLKGDPLSYPILRLNSNDKLVLEFDDLNMNNQVGEYQYTFIHCNYDWEQSDLNYDEFIDGFDENFIKNYDFSFNTVVNYVHYELEFPNEDVKFLKSGNYIIKVYKDYDTSETVLQLRFLVVDPQVEIKGQVRYPSYTEYKKTHQEVDFSVISNYQLSNPLQWVKAVVVKNFDWNFSKTLSPKYLRGNELIYNYELENLFLGGNEFRFFSTKNFNFLVPPIEKIETEKNIYNIFLAEAQPAIHYFSIQDINGKFYIRNEKGHNDKIEADYCYVYFALQAPENLKDKIYIYGQLSNYEFSPKFKMKYNPLFKHYTLKLFLKQGFYNFQFLVKDPKNPYQIEGSFSETENQYFVFVYYYNNALDYYELIGYQILKSR